MRIYYRRFILFCFCWVLAAGCSASLLRKNATFPKHPKVWYVTDNARMYFHSKYPGYFIGFSYAGSKDRLEAIKIARLKALANLTESISVSLIAVTEFIKTETLINEQQVVNEEFKKFIFSYSNKSIREPEYIKIRSWTDAEGKYHIKMAALKYSMDFFRNYIYMPGEINNKQKEKFAEVFEKYFIKLYER